MFNDLRDIWKEAGYAEEDLNKILVQAQTDPLLSCFISSWRNHGNINLAEVILCQSRANILLSSTLVNLKMHQVIALALPVDEEASLKSDAYVRSLTTKPPTPLTK